MFARVLGKLMQLGDNRPPLHETLLGEFDKLVVETIEILLYTNDDDVIITVRRTNFRIAS